MNQKTKSETADSLAQASSRWNIPRQVMQAAKRAGCPAFAGSRIHRAELEKWIRENPAKAKAAEKQGQERQVLAELQRQKLQAEVDLLNSKNTREESETINRAAAKSEWHRAERIAFEIAGELMEPDHFRVFQSRTQSRIGDILGVRASTINNS